MITSEIYPCDGLLKDSQKIRQSVVLSSGEGNDDNNGGGGNGSDIGLATKAKPKTKKPSMYKVIMLNDDYTPMEFVVMILQEVFRKTQDEATQIMLNVHKRGVGVCGVYTYEIAETKVVQVMDIARKNQHPLQLQLEKE